MPEMHDVADGGPRVAADVMQIIDTWLGRSGKGVPLRQVSINDQSLYAGRFKNIDPVNGLAFLAEGPTGVHLAEATRTGFAYSSDGVNSGLVPVSQSAAETISGAKTFSGPLVASGTLAVTGATTLTGPTALGSKITWKRGTSTVSAGALTIPTDGNLIPITGTTTITSIAVAVAGLIVCLEFASAGCKVSMGSTIRIAGDFVSSAAGDTLTLECDGTNWNQIGRGRFARQGVLCAASGQTLTADAAYVAVALAAAAHDRYGIKSGNTFVAPWAGSFDCKGSLQIEASSSGNRNVAIHKNGSLVATVAHGASLSGLNDYGCSWCVPMDLAAGDIVDVRAKSAAVNVLVRTTSWLALDYVGAI